MTDQRRFRVMGTSAHVLVVGGRDGAAERAEQRLRDLERRWSRFLPESELSLLNAAGGAPCIVSPDTIRLVETLQHAWHHTGGRFDPTVHDAMIDLGYKNSWPPVPHAASSAPRATAGCGGVDIDASTRMIRLPARTHLDPGGLGKGLAADVVVEELLGEGARGALVNVGGDLRVAGEPPESGEWRIRIEHPTKREHTIGMVTLIGGGIATTSRMHKQWSIGDRAVHHVLDPSTGQPAERAWAAVTVVAGSGWRAEALAKLAFLDGTLDDHNASALFVDEDGSTRSVGQDAERCFRLNTAVGA
jgi:thiamine biosynthesis lipoprotein